jgi:hypothetical protein
MAVQNNAREVAAELIKHGANADVHAEDRDATER